MGCCIGKGDVQVSKLKLDEPWQQRFAKSADMSGVPVNSESYSTGPGQITRRRIGAFSASKINEVIAAAEGLQFDGTLTDWQRDWCSPEVVQIYLKGRKGNIKQSAEILAQALNWREEHRLVLSGERIPRWQGDLRVLARGEHGHPLVYLCARHQAAGAKTADLVDHMAAVMEAAVQNMGGSATQMDILMDCHGFRVSNNLNPSPVVAFAAMLKHPYRDRLRYGFVVDAPSAFDVLWKVGQRVLPPATTQKIRFLTHEEATRLLTKISGSAVAEAASDVMATNRDSSTEGVPPSRCTFPSEDLGTWQDILRSPSRAGTIVRTISRTFSETFGDVPPQVLQQSTQHHRFWICFFFACVVFIMSLMMSR